MLLCCIGRKPVFIIKAMVIMVFLTLMNVENSVPFWADRVGRIKTNQDPFGIE